MWSSPSRFYGFLADINSEPFPLVGIERAQKKARPTSYIENPLAFCFALKKQFRLVCLRGFNPGLRRFARLSPVILGVESGQLVFRHFGQCSDHSAACAFGA